MSTKKRQSTPARVSLDPDQDIDLIGIRRAADLPPARKERRSKYDDLIDRAARLRPGEVLEVRIQSDDDPEKVRGKISATVRRYAQPQTAHRLMTRMTSNGTVGIYCYES